MCQVKMHEKYGKVACHLYQEHFDFASCVKLVFLGCFRTKTWVLELSS